MSEPDGTPSASPPDGGPAPQPAAPSTPPPPSPSAPAPPGTPAVAGPPDAQAPGAAPARETGPLSARPRTLAKAAGLTLIIFGGFFTLMLTPAVLLLAQPGQIESGPGGVVRLTVPSGPFANVTLAYPDGSEQEATTDANGTARLELRQARFDLTVQSGSRTVRRDGLVPTGFEMPAEVKLDEPAGPTIGVSRETLRYTFVQSLVLLLVNLVAIVGGLAAFRLKGLRLALAGALLFFVQAAYLWLTIIPGFQGLVFLLTAGLALFFTYKARPLFAPWPAPWRRRAPQV